MSGSGGYEFAKRMPTGLVESLHSSLAGRKPKLPTKSQDTETLSADGDGAMHRDPSGSSFAEDDPAARRSEQAQMEGEIEKPSETGFQRIDIAESESVRPSYYWTWRLLMDGYTLQEVKQMRQIDSTTAVEHLIQASQNTLESDPQLDQLRTFIDENSTIDRAKMISRLPKSLTPQQLMYLLQVDRAKESPPRK